MNFHHMLAHVEGFTVPAKMVALGLLATGAAVADSFQAADVKKWEELGTKGLMLAAIFGLVRFAFKLMDKLETQQIRYDTKLKELTDNHKTDYVRRDDDMRATMNRNTEAVERLVEVAEKQAGFFDNITSELVRERLKSGSYKVSVLLISLALLTSCETWQARRTYSLYYIAPNGHHAGAGLTIDPIKSSK